MQKTAPGAGSARNAAPRCLLCARRADSRTSPARNSAAVVAARCRVWPRPLIATPAGASSAEAERRPVTVLFADLCGYTRLSQQLDPEDIHQLLERFFGVVDAIVERFGGRVDKHVGDAVMAVFGAPVAHGDEPARAVRAAEAIQRAMPDIGALVGFETGHAYRDRCRRGCREWGGQRTASRLYGDWTVGQSRGASRRHRGRRRSRDG